MNDDDLDDCLAEISVLKIKLGCLLNLLDDDFHVGARFWIFRLIKHIYLNKKNINMFF